jgi:hypothetical protein
MDEIEELKTKVGQLKKNRENVPLETLRTKYRKPYRELLDKISRLAEKIYREVAGEGIVMMTNDSEVLVRQIQQAVDEQEESVSNAIFKEYDVEKFLRIAQALHTTVWNLWIPYWQTHCCLYAVPECFEEPYPQPRIYNDLTKEFLIDEENCIWEKHPEWESEKRTIITAGACHVLVEAMKEKESKDEQTGEH